MDEPLYTSDAAHLRAQLTALAEEHETLAAQTRIVEANLKALVEKVKAFYIARAVVVAAYEAGEDVDAIGPQCDAAEAACNAMLDLAQRLDV